MLKLKPNCECCDKDLAAGRSGRRDLLVRMHVLRGLRGHPPRGRRLSELRRGIGAPAGQAGRQAREVSGID